MAQRAGLGIARVGGGGGNSSGDIFLAFSTANAGRMSYKTGSPEEALAVDHAAGRLDQPSSGA